MTAPMLSQHPTEEVLAAYVDNQLDSAARSEVTEHLVSCGECREIVLMTTEYQANEASNVRQGSFGHPWLAAAALAAAASIAVIVVQPSWLFGPNVEDLVAASERTVNRSSQGRLAGERVYRAALSVTRGVDDKQDGSAGKAELYEMAVKLHDAKRPDRHTLGLSKLLLAEKGADFNAAVTDLETALKEARGEERDVVAINLAAALIANAGWSRADAENYGRALDLSNDVLQRKPDSQEALWNRAMAMSSMTGKENDAIRAWDDYLRADSDSQWAVEAKRQKALLQSGY